MSLSNLYVEVLTHEELGHREMYQSVMKQEPTYIIYYSLEKRCRGRLLSPFFSSLSFTLFCLLENMAEGCYQHGHPHSCLLFSSFQNYEQ